MNSRSSRSSPRPAAIRADASSSSCRASWAPASDAVQRGSTHLLWLHPACDRRRRSARARAARLAHIRAVGVMLPGYLKLKLSLEIAGFRPVLPPVRLAARPRQARAWIRTQRSKDPAARKVLVVAHSMGGLVARAALAHDKRRRIERLRADSARRTKARSRPLQALRAVYPTVRKIASLDRTHTAEALARSRFPHAPGSLSDAADNEGRREPRSVRCRPVARRRNETGQQTARSSASAAGAACPPPTSDVARSSV